MPSDEAPTSRALDELPTLPRASSIGFNHPILFLKPHRLVVPASWAGHLPFAFWLIAAHRPRVIVELGTHAGTSYCGFCQAVHHLHLPTACFAVDTWHGEPHAGASGEDVFAELSTYHDARYSAFSSLVRTTFDDARLTFPDGSIDLLHIDGCYEHETARHDVQSWMPKLSSRGVMLIHDVSERRPGFDVDRLWDELRTTYPSFTFLHSHGLGVLAVGVDQSPEVRWLTEPGRSEAELDAIRDHFVTVAAEVVELGELKDAVRLLSQDVAEARAERDAAESERRRETGAGLQLQQRVAALESELARMSSSKSWWMTAALRNGRRSLGRAKYAAAVQAEQLLRNAYLRLPITSQHRWAIKTFGFRMTGWLMRGTASYQRWQGTIAQATATTVATDRVLDERDVPRLVDNVRFPVVARPSVSVIVPVHGQLAYTARCLASIARHLPQTPIEILVVDDQSPDASADVLEAVDGIRVLRNDSQLGFVGSCNRGAREACGEYLIFLNNDTEVQAGWCDELVRTFVEVPGCGIAGSKLIYPDGRLQEAGGIVWRNGSAWNYGRMDDPRKPVYCYRRDVDYVSGAVLAVPRALFLEVGGFDTSYAPAYYEDVDLAFKVRDLGRRVVFQPRSMVVHYEGITSGRDVHSGVKASQIENAKTFRARWGSRLAAHHEVGVHADRARERGVQFRVLFLDHHTPEPDKDAGSGAVLHLFHILQGLGGKITFIPEDNYLYLDPYTSDLQRMGVECLYAPFVTSVKEHLQDTGDAYDLVLMYRYTTGMRHLTSIRRYARHAKVVLLDVDLHFLREMREADVREDQAIRDRALRVKQQELSVIRRVDYTMVHSTVERDVLAAECSTCPVAVFGWVADAVGAVTPYESRRDLLFVGGFQHSPNVDAVLYFVHDILPRIHERLPDVRLYVVGSNPPPVIRELKSDTVIVTGYVPDLRPLFEQVRIAVAPLRFGAGVKGKVASAMAHGVPAVATPIAAEGMDLVRDRDIVVADSPADFADAVCSVYSNPEWWNDLSNAGLAAVEREFSSTRASTVIAGVLEHLGIAVSRGSVRS